MAIRKPFDDVGRGNETAISTVAVPGEPSTIIFDVPTDLVIGTALTDEVIVRMRPVGATIPLVIQITRTRTLGSAAVVVAIGTNAGADAAVIIARAVNANTNFIASNNGAEVTISNAVAGLVGASPILETGGTVTNPPSIKDSDLGSDPTSVEVDSYSFSGPFTNANPSGDPIQGLTRMGMLFNQFIFNVGDVVSEAGQISAAAKLRTSLIAAFPQSFASDGITRTSAQSGKIALKGSRRDSNGLVGRGKRNINSIFVNETADFGLRQIVLRIFDSVTELFILIAEGTSSAAAVAAFARNEMRNLSVDFGELERALGSLTPRPYENTIVDLSSDQGLLIYSDDLSSKIVNFSGTLIGDLRTALDGAIRLKLRN